MTDRTINETDLRLLGAMTGATKIKLLLAERGLSLRAFSREYNVWVQEASLCINGHVPYERIRDALAEALDTDRPAIDYMIDGEPNAEAA